MPYTLVDHTGDIALALEGADAAALFDGLTRGLLHVLTDEASCEVREDRAHEVTLEAGDLAELLVAFGNEWLFLFEVEQLLGARVELTALDEDAPDGVAGTFVLHGERFDPERHPIARPFKAVTHHDAVVTRHDAGLRASIVIDL